MDKKKTLITFIHITIIGDKVRVLDIPLRAQIEGRVLFQVCEKFVSKRNVKKPRLPATCDQKGELLNDIIEKVSITSLGKGP